MEGSEASGSAGRPVGCKKRESTEDFRVKRESLQAVLERCQRALELLKNADDEEGGSFGGGSPNLPDEIDDDSSSVSSQCGSSGGDSDAAELCDLLKSRVESPTFLEKLGSIHMSAPQNMTEESSSWDLISKTDWDDELDQDGYVVVKQEDIVEGIACFMAAYLLSLKQTKELTPAQLQEALSKTFSVKKRKSKLRKAWDGSKVIYNVASWGATAIGIYQNPALFRAASAAFWTSCRVISKLL